jgi:thiol-disulfide isomerase/thioredoxin
MTKFLLLLTILATSCTSQAEKPKGGILDQKAPAITADQWVSLPPGAKAPTPESLKGKVIYLYCFQSWCPGCHSSGFPTLQKVSTHFKDDKAVQCIAIQTVFEGFGTNTSEKALAVAKKYKLTGIPVGHSGSKEKRSAIMSGFKTRGTPWTIIIGKDGIVKYNDFHIKPEAAIKLIDKLKK